MTSTAVNPSILLSLDMISAAVNPCSLRYDVVWASILVPLDMTSVAVNPCILVPLSPFLIGRTVYSPNILRTVRRTINRFLTFCLLNMVRTVRRTMARS